MVPTEVAAAATVSRQQVENIQAQSETVITNSSQLSLALSEPERVAQQSVDTATQAKTIALDNNAVSNI